MESITHSGSTRETRELLKYHEATLCVCIYIYISTLKLGDASRRISYIEDKIRIFEFEKRSKAIDDLIGMIIFSKLLFF